MRDPLWNVEFEHERRMSEIKDRYAIQDDFREVVYHKKSLRLNLRQEEPMRHTKVYEVWAFGGEDPDNIVTIPSGNPFTFAADEAEAILKSRICETISGYKGLDFKYVTVICKEIGCIKVAS